MDKQTADEWGLDQTDQMVLLWGEGWGYVRIGNLFNLKPTTVESRIYHRFQRMETELTFPKTAKWLRN